VPERSFTLIGHDSPLGYPGPVVPIGFLGDNLVAVYASGKPVKIEIPLEECVFVRHQNDPPEDSLSDFDIYSQRLFALSENVVERYSVEDEIEYFKSLLEVVDFAQRNPFIRLTLAKAVKKQSYILPELFRCGLHLSESSPSFAEIWFDNQKINNRDPFIYDLPDSWEEIELFLTPGQIRSIRQFYPQFKPRDRTFITEPIWPFLELGKYTTPELELAFKESRGTNLEQFYLEALIDRFYPLTKALVRKDALWRTPSLPAWMDQQDIVADVMLNILPVFRNLSTDASFVNIIRNNVRERFNRVWHKYGRELNKEVSVDSLPEHPERPFLIQGPQKFQTDFFPPYSPERPDLSYESEQAYENLTGMIQPLIQDDIDRAIFYQMVDGARPREIAEDLHLDRSEITYRWSKLKAKAREAIGLI
jgi:DNA-directed RNA polymerase specialized sigma24 family protein